MPIATNGRSCARPTRSHAEPQWLIWVLLSPRNNPTPQRSVGQSLRAVRIWGAEWATVPVTMATRLLQEISKAHLVLLIGLSIQKLTWDSSSTLWYFSTCITLNYFLNLGWWNAVVICWAHCTTYTFKGQFAYLSICLAIYLFFYLSIHLYIYLSIYQLFIIEMYEKKKRLLWNQRGPLITVILCYGKCLNIWIPLEQCNKTKKESLWFLLHENTNCHYECRPEHDVVPECFLLSYLICKYFAAWHFFYVLRLTGPSAIQLFCELHECNMKTFFFLSVGKELVKWSWKAKC